jgi:predicted MFS family arabinose efflux permease
VTAAGRVKAAWRGGPLADRNFRLLTAGQFTSTVGDFCYAVALPWLVLSTHGGPVLLGTVLACYGVPRTVLIPLGGVLADKFGPRTIMLAADVVRCGLAAALAVFAARNLASLAALGPVAALLGAGEGLFLPASFAIMPALLEPDGLQAGNALNSAVVQLGSLLGPVLGGALVALAGSAPAFAVDAASFGVSAAALALISRRATAADADAQPGTQPDSPPGAQPDAGSDAGSSTAQSGRPQDAAPNIWRLLRTARLLQVIIIVCVAANFAFGGTLEVALPTLAHASFGAAGYGVLIACFGAGEVTGTLAAARAKALGRPALVACAAFVAEGAAVGVVPFLGGLPGAAAAILVFGSLNGFGNVIMITLLQQWAPSRLIGRVMSMVMLASMGTFPVSVAISGVLVRSFGPAVFFPVAGAALALTVLGAVTQREIRDFGVSPGPAGPGVPAEPHGPAEPPPAPAEPPPAPAGPHGPAGPHAPAGLHGPAEPAAGPA